MILSSLAAYRTEFCADSKKNDIKVEMPKHDCPGDLLRDQQRVMGEYLHILEVRAAIEGVELNKI